VIGELPDWWEIKFHALVKYLSRSPAIEEVDIRQELAMWYTYYANQEEEYNPAFLYVCLRNHGKDYLRSKRVNYSYKNKFPHMSWEEMLGVAEKDLPEQFVEYDFENEVASRLWCEKVFTILSVREEKILRLLMDGYKKKDIVEILGCSVFTVWRDMNAIRQKLQEACDNNELDFGMVKGRKT